MTSSRYPKCMLWLGGLMLVFALLAHDVLMASAAYTVPPVQTAPTPRGHDFAHQSVAVESRLPVNDAGPEHPGDCGTIGTAIPPVGHPLDLGDLATPAMFALGNLPPLARASARCWSEPLSPPGTRRALIQVYRI